MSRGTRERAPGRDLGFRLRGYHPLWPAFPDRSATRVFCNSPRGGQTPLGTSRNPGWATPARFNTHPVWALPLSLAATRGVSVDFLSSPY